MAGRGEVGTSALILHPPTSRLDKAWRYFFKRCKFLHSRASTLALKLNSAHLEFRALL